MIPITQVREIATSKYEVLISLSPLLSPSPSLSPSLPLPLPPRNLEVLSDESWQDRSAF